MESIVLEKTTVGKSHVSRDKNFVKDDSIAISFDPSHIHLVIEYLTNLYSDPVTAMVRELFTNACDADPSGFVKMGFKQSRWNGNKVTFYVEDDGCGMSRDELVNNYIQYANSSKTKDLGTVGAFGLGSKSPLAVSDGYIVESCDGDTVHRVTVKRTNEGFFGNVDELDKSDRTFTRVMVDIPKDGIEVEKVREYVQFLADYSGRGIIFDDVFVERSYACARDFMVETPEETGDDTTNNRNITFMFPEELKDGQINDMVDYHLGKFKDSDGNDRFNLIARVKNTPYPIETYIAGRISLVIDVEPGYFAFAPSREELPKGDSYNTILSEITTPIFNEDDGEQYFAWLSENEIIPDGKMAYRFIKKIFNKPVHFRSICYQSSAAECDSYDLVQNINIRDEDYVAHVNDLLEENDCKVIEYRKTTHRKSFEYWGEVRALNILDTINKNLFTSDGTSISSIHGFTLSSARVFTGCKKTRKGEIKVPTCYASSFNARLLHDTMLHGDILDFNSDYRKNRCVVYGIYTPNDSISDELKTLLRLGNFHVNRFSEIHREDVEYYALPAVETKKKRTKDAVKKELLEREIEATTFYHNRDYIVTVAQFMEKFPSEGYVVHTGSKRSFTSFYRTPLSRIQLVTGKKVTHINLNTKGARELLEENGYDVYQDVEDNYDMNKLNEFTKKHRPIAMAEDADFMSENFALAASAFIKRHHDCRRECAVFYNNKELLDFDFIDVDDEIANSAPLDFYSQHRFNGKDSKHQTFCEHLIEHLDTDALYKKLEGSLTGYILKKKLDDEIHEDFRPMFKCNDADIESSPIRDIESYMDNVMEQRMGEFKDKAEKDARNSKDYEAICAFKNLSFVPFYEDYKMHLTDMESNPVVVFIGEQMKKDLEGLREQFDKVLV